MGFAAIQSERGSSKTQKTYFLKNITIFFVLLEFFCNFVADYILPTNNNQRIHNTL